MAIQLFGDLVDACAHPLGVSRFTASLILALPFIVIGGSVISLLLGKRMYLQLVGEDGLFENMQAVLFASSCVGSLILSRIHHNEGDELTAALYFLLCLGLFFLTGEEISWGQRLFNWRTTGLMAEINGQGETNLHNIRGVQSIFRWVQLAVGAYGLFAPLVVRRIRAVGRWREVLAATVPPYALMPYFGLMFAWRCFRNFFHAGRFEFVAAEFNEVLELELALGLFLFMLLQWKRLRRPLATW